MYPCCGIKRKGDNKIKISFWERKFIHGDEKILIMQSFKHLILMYGNHKNHIMHSDKIQHLH